MGRGDLVEHAHLAVRWEERIRGAEGRGSGGSDDVCAAGCRDLGRAVVAMFNGRGSTEALQRTEDTVRNLDTGSLVVSAPYLSAASTRNSNQHLGNDGEDHRHEMHNLGVPAEQLVRCCHTSVSPGHVQGRE
jgi:hypothetical protein